MTALHERISGSVIQEAQEVLLTSFRNLLYQCLRPRDISKAESNVCGEVKSGRRFNLFVRILVDQVRLIQCAFEWPRSTEQ